MSDAAQRIATYRDVLAAPDNMIAEIISGHLYTQPRPAARHTRAMSQLGYDLVGPFDRGKAGPGGWHILDEPELHIGPQPDILVPDMAGWRISTLPSIPDEAFIKVAPDWVCEALSPGTALRDRTLKMPIYQRERVRHVWLLDPQSLTLEIYRLDGESYRLAGAYGGDAIISAEPFDAIELNLSHLWLNAPKTETSQTGEPSSLDD